MPDNRKAERLMQAAVAVFIPIFIILLPFRILVFNEHFYSYELEKLGVFRDVNNSKIMLNETIDLLKHGEPFVKEYTQRENLHLLDVKSMFDFCFALLGLSVIVLLVCGFLLFKKNKKLFYSSVWLGSWAAISLIFVLAACFLLNFNFSFEMFHKIFFQPGTYIFNPETELLKAVFPDKFFSDFAVYCFGASVLLSVILSVSSYLLKKHRI